MASVLGLFGVIPFICSDSAVLTYKDVKITHNSRYAQHAVIGQVPVNEYIGPEQQTINFKIQLRQQLNVPPSAALLLLSEMLQSGESQRLLLGPEYLGKFILENYEEERIAYGSLGIPISVDVTLSLREAKGFSLFSYLKELV